MYTTSSRTTTKKTVKQWWNAKKGKKMNHIKYLVKTRKGRKWVEEKTRNKEQEQQVETVINMVNINPII